MRDVAPLCRGWLMYNTGLRRIELGKYNYKRHNPVMWLDN